MLRRALIAPVAMLSVVLAVSNGLGESKKSCGCVFKTEGVCAPTPCDEDFALKGFITRGMTDVDKDSYYKFIYHAGSSGRIASSIGPIFDTGYNELTTLGGETSGYALYSYAIVTANTPRTRAFMKEFFKSIKAIDVFDVPKNELNVLHIPVIGSKKKQFQDLKKAVGPQDYETLAEKYMDSFYDQSMALTILNRICTSAEGKMLTLCKSDISEGPFLFTYAKPVTTLQKVPPPYLIADLRPPMHVRAFETILSRFKEQVKSKDFADDQRIHTFGTSLLSILLTTADWTDLVARDIGTVVHTIGLSATEKK
ncbi:MAG: hypothetical protein ACK4UO_19015 [Pseudolabrys sp.]